MRTIAIACSVLLAHIAVPAYAQQKDQRGGDCEQTKSQYEYFCTKQGDPGQISPVITLSEIWLLPAMATAQKMLPILSIKMAGL